MVEQNNAIRNVFFKTMASKRPAAGFCSDHRGNALTLEPAKQSPQFAPNYGFIGQATEEHFNGIHHYTLCADAAYSVLNANKQPRKIVLTGFFELVSRYLHVIDNQHFLLQERGNVIP